MIRYTIRSDDIISGDISNGLFKVNSQQNNQLTKFLNEGKKYKIVVSKFLLTNGSISSVISNAKYIIEVKLNNMMFDNSFIGDNLDKSIYRDTADEIEETDTTTLNDTYSNNSINDKSIGLFSNDRIIENGLLNIQIQYIDHSDGEEKYLPFIEDLGRWLLEFFVIFD